MSSAPATVDFQIFHWTLAPTEKNFVFHVNRFRPKLTDRVSELQVYMEQISQSQK